MGTTPQWPGFGKRLVESIQKAGFPNVAQFADAKGYRITYAYKWASGTTPDPENLIRLTKDLGVSLEWLLRGDEVSKVPVPPRKRGARKIGCLVAALLGLSGTPASWGPPRSLEADAPASSVSHTDNVRGILSRWWRKITPQVVVASCASTT